MLAMTRTSLYGLGSETLRTHLQEELCYLMRLAGAGTPHFVDHSSPPQVHVVWRPRGGRRDQQKAVKNPISGNPLISRDKAFADVIAYLLGMMNPSVEFLVEYTMPMTTWPRRYVPIGGRKPERIVRDEKVD